MKFTSPKCIWNWEKMPRVDSQGDMSFDVGHKIRNIIPNVDGVHF